MHKTYQIEDGEVQHCYEIPSVTNSRVEVNLIDYFEEETLNTLREPHVREWINQLIKEKSL